MMPTPINQRHDWQFTATEIQAPMANGTGSGSAPVLIAACKACGLVRTIVAGAGRELRIDVTGVCPGAAALSRSRSSE